MINKPELVVGDYVIVYLRNYPPIKDAVNIKSLQVRSIGVIGATWMYNYDETDAFTYNSVEYILRKGKWRKHA